MPSVKMILMLRRQSIHHSMVGYKYTQTLGESENAAKVFILQVHLKYRHVCVCVCVCVCVIKCAPLYRHWGSVLTVLPIGGLEVQLYRFMPTAPEGGEGSASRSGRSLPPGKTRYPLYKRLSGPQGQSGQVRKISPPPEFDPRTVQLVASRYTDWATRTTVCIIICYIFLRLHDHWTTKRMIFKTVSENMVLCWWKSNFFKLIPSQEILF